MTPTSGAGGARAGDLDTLLVEVVLVEGGHGREFCTRAEWGSVGEEERKMEKEREERGWRREEWRRKERREWGRGEKEGKE